MYINNLHIKNFRCFSSSSFTFESGLNFLIGDNGCGKTTILESIYYLLRLKSFRSNQVSPILRLGESKCELSANLIKNEFYTNRVQIYRSKSSKKVLIDSTYIRNLSDLYLLAPVLFFGPESTNLFLNSSQYRRKFLDYALFHVEPKFHFTWKQYHHLLKQRNCAIKDGDSRLIEVYASGLARYGLELNKYRKQFVYLVSNEIESIALFNNYFINVGLTYIPGFDDTLDLCQSFSCLTKNERLLKYTTHGPHKYDYLFEQENQNITQFLSRGEIKLLYFIFFISIMMVLYKKYQLSPILEIDDLSSEFSLSTFHSIFDILYEIPSQIFITFNNFYQYESAKEHSVNMIHVEH